VLEGKSKAAVYKLELDRASVPRSCSSHRVHPRPPPPGWASTGWEAASRASCAWCHPSGPAARGLFVPRL